MKPDKLLMRSQQPTTDPYDKSQMNPVKHFSLYFSRIYSNIILPSTTRTSKWPVPFRFSS
jgi:hypothetical protein